MSDHAVYSPSACYRNMACLGAVAVSIKAEKLKAVPAPSEYAKEGTTYHNYLAAYLNKPYEDVIADASEEMREYLKDELVFTFTIMKNFQDKYPNAKHVIEEKVIYNDNFWGTVDFLMTGEHKGKKALLIKDTKYGKGVAVDAVKNYQMLCYAICAEKHYTTQFDSFHFFIYQPRIGDTPYTRWTIEREEFKKYQEEIIHNLLEQLNNVNSGSYPCTAGDHCRFCPGRLICPELRHYQNSSALKILDEIPEIPEIDNLSIEQKLKIRSLRKTIEQLLDDIDEDLHTRAMQGEKLPGFKLVQSAGRRQWAGNIEEIANALKALGVNEPYETSLKGITAIEKEIGKNKIDNFVAYNPGKTLLVPESDKREEFKTISINTIKEIDGNH